jgi:hypothetical protein
MNWYSNLEQKRATVLFAILLLSTAILAVTAMQDPKSYDSFWHLKMGEDLVESGLSPWQDNYSFTYRGSKITSPPVFFQVALFSTVEWLGLEPGYKFYKFAGMMLVLLMALAWLKRVKAPVMIYCLVLPLLLVLLQTRATVRPEHLSYALCIFALVLYDRAQAGTTVKTMLPIVVLMLFWTNYHSAILGYIIFCGLFIDLGIKQLGDHAPARAWGKWLAWGVLIVAVGFLNPSFSHPFLQMMFFPDEWKTLIMEYQSPLIYKYVPAIYILLFIVVTTLTLLVRQRSFGYLFVSAVLLSNAAMMSRVVAPAGIVLLCIFAFTMSRQQFKSMMSDASSKRLRIPGFIALIVFLVPLINSVLIARVAVKSSFTYYFPTHMVEYMKSAGRKGRIFNEYELGGYLIYHLAPDSEVYIDGRTGILYPFDHYLKMQEAGNSPDILKSEIEKYDIDYFIMRNTADDASLMADAGPMKLDFADVRYFLYSRHDANFPTSGLLWGRPHCWKKSMIDDVAQERAKAIQLLPEASPLHALLDVASSFTDYEDKKALVAKLTEMKNAMDSVKRFAGYRAIEIGQNDLAIQLFNKVDSKNPKDFLAISLANLHAGETDQAEQTLDQATSVKWESLEFIDILMLHGLLYEIQGQRPLKFVERDYFEALSNRVGQSGEHLSGGKVSTASFCPGFDHR